MWNSKSLQDSKTPMEIIATGTLVSNFRVNIFSTSTLPQWSVDVDMLLWGVFLYQLRASKETLNILLKVMALRALLLQHLVLFVRQTCPQFLGQILDLLLFGDLHCTAMSITKNGLPTTLKHVLYFMFLVSSTQQWEQTSCIQSILGSIVTYWEASLPLCARGSSLGQRMPTCCSCGRRSRICTRTGQGKNTTQKKHVPDDNKLHRGCLKHDLASEARC